jgi:hypothetical protein
VIGNLPDRQGSIELACVVERNWLEFSWSEKALGPPTVPVSLVTPVTLSNDPTALDMQPGKVLQFTNPYGELPIASADASFPLPTLSGRGPRAGGYGSAGAVVQDTSCQSVLGYEDAKHPLLDGGIRAMPALQFFNSSADGSCVTTWAVGAAPTDPCAMAGAANAITRNAGARKNTMARPNELSSTSCVAMNDSRNAMHLYRIIDDNNAE